MSIFLGCAVGARDRGIELLVVQRRVCATAGEQVCMRSLFDNPPVFYDEDDIRPQHRAQPMCDRERRTPSRELIKQLTSAALNQ